MSSAIFLSDNLIKNSQLSVISGTINTQFPLDNIKHDFSTKVARSTTSSLSILIDTQHNMPVDFIALRGSCIDGLGLTSATIVSSATTVFTSTPVDIDVNHLNNFGFVSLTSSTNRYYKLTLTGSSYVEISNLFLGAKVVLANNNISQGFSYSLNTDSKTTKNIYGQRFSELYGTTKMLSGEIQYVNAGEFDVLNDIHVTNGDIYPIWFILDSNNDTGITDSRYLFSGMFYMKDLVWKNVAPSLWNVQIVLEECK